MYKIIIPKAELIAKISFTVFIFFAIFPTSLPFQETNQEIGANELITSNIFNQVLYSSLFVLSLIAGVSNFTKVVDLLFKGKALSIFLLWALISMFWSDYPLVTFKRWFQVFTYLWITVVFFSFYPNTRELVRILKPITYFYIIITLISVVIIPAALDPAFGTWRGLTPHKNVLGENAVLLSVFTLIFATSETDNIKKYIAYVFFIISIIIVIGSLSSTSYIALFNFLMITLIFFIHFKVFNKIGVSYFLSFALIIFSILTLALSLYYIPDVLNGIQGIFGKSETFLDRGKLWQVILWNIAQHPILGCGFQGFWVVDSPRIQLIYETFVWLPNQGHNTYLDIINEVGIVGLILFIIVILNYFIITIKSKRFELWSWLIIIPLISGVTESYIFRPGMTSTIFFLLGYMTLFIEHEPQ